MTARPLLLCVVLFLVACGGGGYSSPSPPGNQQPPGDNDPDPYDPGEVEPTLASIQDRIFTPICTQCHAGAAAPNGLRLEEGIARAMLVDIASVNEPAIDRVEPGDPDNSYIIHKLEGTQNVGERMPLGGPYLTTANIQAIRQWIEDGADPGPPPPTNKVAGTWPVEGAYLPAPPAHVIVVFDQPLDTSRVGADSVRLLRVAGVEAMPVDGARIALTAPNTVRISVPASSWHGGRYELQVMGVGPFRVLDKAGNVVDGNGDGIPGGDFVMQFTVATGA